MEPEIEHIYTELPTEAVSGVRLDYLPPPKWGIFPQPLHEMLVLVRRRYAQVRNTAVYRQTQSYMTREQAIEWAKAKAKQLEEGTE